MITAGQTAQPLQNLPVRQSPAAPAHEFVTRGARQAAPCRPGPRYPACLRGRCVHRRPAAGPGRPLPRTTEPSRTPACHTRPVRHSRDTASLQWQVSTRGEAIKKETSLAASITHALVPAAALQNKQARYSLALRSKAPRTPPQIFCRRATQCPCHSAHKEHPTRCTQAQARAASASPRLYMVIDRAPWCDDRLSATSCTPLCLCLRRSPGPPPFTNSSTSVELCAKPQRCERAAATQRSNANQLAPQWPRDNA